MPKPAVREHAQMSFGGLPDLLADAHEAPLQSRLSISDAGRLRRVWMPPVWQASSSACASQALPASGSRCRPFGSPGHDGTGAYDQDAADDGLTQLADRTQPGLAASGPLPGECGPERDPPDRRTARQAEPGGEAAPAVKCVRIGCECRCSAGGDWADPRIGEQSTQLNIGFRGRLVRSVANMLIGAVIDVSSGRFQ